MNWWWWTAAPAVLVATIYLLAGACTVLFGSIRQTILHYRPAAFLPWWL